MADFFGLIGVFVPLFVVLWLANMSERQRQVRDESRLFAVIAYLALVSIYLTLMSVGLLLQSFSFVISRQPQLLETLGNGLVDASMLERISSTSVMGIGVWAPALLGILLLTPPLRRLCARFLPIDADSSVHAVAMSLTMLIVVNMLVTLSIGLETLAEALAQQDDLGGSVTVAMLWTQQILMLLLAMVGVGWLSRRSLSEAMQRLGITGVSGRQVLIGMAAAMFMLPISVMLQQIAIFLGFGAAPDVEVLTDQLLGSLFQSPLGIITLGLAAAVGEEPLFRGAMQPRFGVLLTALLFAVVHSNYGLSVSTVLVFVLGLVLAWLRIRHNTTTAMIAHATYNMTIWIDGVFECEDVGYVGLLRAACCVRFRGQSGFRF